MQITDNIHAFEWESMTRNNCNTYLIDGPTKILIDPGHADLFDHVVSGLNSLKITIDDIDLVICTHAHPDHIEAVGLFQDAPARFAIHEKDWELVKSMFKYLGSTTNVKLENLVPDFFLEQGDFSVGGIPFEIFHTPGHSPGSICICQPDQKVLFTGDLVFAEGFGRVDLPGGNPELLKASIDRISEIDAEYLLSGHGPALSGKEAVLDNFQTLKQVYLNYI